VITEEKSAKRDSGKHSQGATNESMQRPGKRGERKGFEQEWNTSTTREQEIRQHGIQQPKREHKSREILIKPIGNENTAMRIQ